MSDVEEREAAKRSAQTDAQGSSKLTQDDLRRCDQLFHAVFAGALDAMLLIDDERQLVEANPAACTLLGLCGEKLMGRRIEEFLAPGADVPRKYLAFLAAGQRRGRFSLVREDGVQLELEYSSTANILPSLHLSVLRDVTKRKQTRGEPRCGRSRTGAP